jgi:putative redox protein
VVQIDIEYQGGLRCEAVHEPSGRRLTTDAPTDNRGQGESFSPTDLVATALGTCILTIMGITAEDQGWNLEGARARVEKRMVADPQRRISELEVVISIPRDPGPEARAALEKAASACPVCHSLGQAVGHPVSWKWGA